MKRIYIIFILIVLTTLSCSKDNVKPSADSLLTTVAFNSINTIKEAYEGKNKSALQEHSTPEVAERILKALFFEKAELSFNTRMVRITDLSVIVNLNWQGTWWVAKDKKIEDRGVVNLVLQKETMKLMQIDGDNPFQTPIAE